MAGTPAHQCGQIVDYECWFPPDWVVAGTWWARGWCVLPAGHDGVHLLSPNLGIGKPTGRQIERP
jgi:hypothetical protein